MNTIAPAGANQAEQYIFQATATIASNVAGANKGTDQVQVLSDSFFALFGYMAACNYDNFSGEFQVANVDSSNTQLYGPPRVPSNFEVLIKQDNNFLFSGIPLPQACIAGNGYWAGNQLPFPILYKPLTQFQFEFYNVAPQIMYDSAEMPVAVPMEIKFGMYGYNVPVEQVNAFLSSWPAYQAEAIKNAPGWLRKFTGMDLPGLT